MRQPEPLSWSGLILRREIKPSLRTREVKLTPSLGLTNSAADLRLDSMASRAIPSRPQSVPRCYRTGHWHRNLKVLRISLWRLARQKRGQLLEALRSRWECPAGNAVSTHGCEWSSLCTSLRTGNRYSETAARAIRGVAPEGWGEPKPSQRGVSL